VGGGGLSGAAEHRVELNFPACLAADFPRELPAAERAVDEVLRAIQQSSSFAPLEDRSPGLRGNDWSNYLRCSEARMVHATRLLRKHGMTSGRVLDYGAYFGNFSLMLRAERFTVDALDAFESYRPSLDPVLDLLHAAGITTLDFSKAGRELEGVAGNTYDVVMCMGVIEHVPHTPRTLLDALHRVLKPGGLLVMDTPNLAQLANRQRLARGEAVMTPIAIQYHATIPFEGHHREYTADEMAWMMRAANFELVSLDLFSYSAYGQPALTGRDAINYWRMVANPTMRELVMVVARKPVAGSAPVQDSDWRPLFEDVERYWLDRLPAGISAESGEAVVGNELLIVDLQEGIATRDRLLAELQAAMEEVLRGVTARDQQISSQNDRIDRLQYDFEMTASERLKRVLRRLFRVSS